MHASARHANDRTAPRSGVVPRRLHALVLGGLLIANLAVGLLCADAIQRSRLQHEQQARTLTQNVSYALDQNVGKSIEKMDLALRGLADELERQLAGGGLDDAVTTTFVAQLELRLPEVDAFRIARSDGLVIFGKGLNKNERVSWADRDSFTVHRDTPNAGLHIARPVVGLVAKRPIVGFSRRYNYPDGSFAGVVSAPIAVDYFAQLLTRFDVGSKGTVILRDSNLGLVARHPPLPSNPAGQLGNQVVSDDFRRIFDSGERVATDFTAASPDGFQRIFTFRRLAGAPMVAIVATASVDYLASWKSELYRTVGMEMAFFVLSVLLGGYTLRLLKRAEVTAREVKDSHGFVTSVLNSLSEHVAVIDTQGNITAVNAAWRQFALANGSTNLQAVDVGMNYLTVCSDSAKDPDDSHTPEAAKGIQAVLTGTLPEFKMEYPCHSPTEQRWFILHVLPLQGASQGAVLIHQNVTFRHQAEATLRASEAHFRVLAENMVDVVWKADRNMRITYINDADRRLRGFTRDEVVGQAVAATLTPEGQLTMAKLMAQGWLQAAADSADNHLKLDLPQRCKDGRVIWTEFTTIPTFDASGQISGFQGVGRDVTERKRREAEQNASQQQLEDRLQEISAQQSDLQEKLLHDPLTGLLNRRYLDEALPRELARAKREGYPVALIMIDLDHFKQVNDSFGHAAGDEVLRVLASLLRKGSRESDSICRYGGEEFVVLMPGLSAEAAKQRAESWRVALMNLNLAHHGSTIPTSLSAGIAVFPTHGEGQDTLLAHADAMLYRAKREGRNRIVVYGDD